MKIIVILQDDGNDDRVAIHLHNDKGYDPPAYQVSMGLREMSDDIESQMLNTATDRMVANNIKEPVSQAVCLEYAERIPISSVKMLSAAQLPHARNSFLD